MLQKQVTRLLLGFFIAHFAVAQTTEHKDHFELEADPIAYILHGYSVHLGYQSGHLRWDLGAYGAEEPSFFSGYDNFKIRSNGVGIKMDYLFHKRKGLLLGIESDISKEKVSSKSNDASVEGIDSKTFTNVSVAMRVGYRIMLGKKDNDYRGFYIFPWVSFLSFNLNPQSAIIKGSSYEQKTLSFFPTVHVGYSF